jgi:hypothetical protein
LKQVASSEDLGGPAGHVSSGTAAPVDTKLEGAGNGLGRKPWFSRFSGYLSAFGALISVIGSAVSYNSARQHELQAQHAEVRTIVEKLGRLPREHLELQQKFEGNAVSVAHVSGLINYEMRVLAQRASTLIEKIPGLVAPAERLYIGNALLYVNLWAQAEREFAAVKKMGGELEDVVTAHRFLAQLHYAKGQIEQGRTEFTESKSAVARRVAEGFDPVLAARLDVSTEVRWAGLEAAQKNCAAYEARMRQAMQHFQGMPDWARMQSAGEITMARDSGCPPKMPGSPANVPDQR